ncbi:MAG: hypothetical protein K2X67_16245 [Burkholderiales bacterium]|jgi:hypothetical protein|nr:hypothetical protein [Burkholderiales bacterium]
MCRKSFQSLFVLPLLSVGLALPASAGERIQIAGHYGGFDKSQVLEIGKNHVLVSVVNEGTGYVLDAPHTGTPMQHAAGPCGGSVEIRDGKASGTGYCIRTNPQGGKFVLDWEVNPDASQGVTGKWRIRGIEGNAAGWTGGGTWGPTTQTGGGRFVNRFVGWLEKP